MTGRSLVDVSAFRDLARARRARGVGVMSPTAVVVRSESENRVVRWVLSDGSVDRAGDRIDPAGWNVAAYRRNPVVLFGHDASAPPIGRAPSIWMNGAQLLGDVEFASAEVYPFADTIYRLVRAGYIKAGSVGFLPLEYEFSDDDGREWGIDFKRQELLEFSIVPIPCNANALIDARAQGIDSRPLATWAERALDRGTAAGIPRSQLELLRKAALEPHSRPNAQAARMRLVQALKAELNRQDFLEKTYDEKLRKARQHSDANLIQHYEEMRAIDRKIAMAEFTRKLN